MTELNEKTMRIVDSSCTPEYTERHHAVVIDGKQIPLIFKFGEDMILPYETGAKLMGLEGFRAFDPDTGSEIMVPPKTDETIRIKIAADEIVAKYDELTLGALKVRAASRPGGEVFLTGEVEAKHIISFLKADAAKVHRENENVEEGLEIEMDDEPAPRPQTQEQTDNGKGIGAQNAGPAPQPHHAIDYSASHPKPAETEASDKPADAVVKRAIAMTEEEIAQFKGKEISAALAALDVGAGEPTETDKLLAGAPAKEGGDIKVVATSGSDASNEEEKLEVKADEPVKEEAPDLPPLPGSNPSAVETQEYKEP